MSNLLSWLPPGNQLHPSSGHSMLFMIEESSIAAEVCDALIDEDVRFTCEQAEDLVYKIEAQTED